MGVMDKFLSYMKMNDDNDSEYDDGYLDDEEEVTVKPKKAVVSPEKTEEPAFDERAIRRPQAAKQTPFRTVSGGKKVPVGDGMEVCVIKPTSVEEGREITETLLAKRTVVLNLEGLDVEIAQRIIDFACGSAFALGGNLQKISHYIFIITPKTVDISGDFQDVFGSATFDMPLNGGF